MRFLAVLLFSLTFSIVLASQPEQRTLTFDDRAAAQEAIERVYYAHQAGATRSFEEAVPRSVLEGKVRNYLDQTAALADYWNTVVTDVMLQRELERMSRGTRMPERLSEIYKALGSDSFLIKECFARATLVDRLSRSFFAFDTTIHASARARADELHRQLVTGELSPWADHPNRSVTELVTNEGSSSRPSPDARLSREELRAERAMLPDAVGEIPPLRDSRDAFLVEVVLRDSPSEVLAAHYVVPKSGWDVWWGTARRSVHGDVVPAVATAGGLPPLASCIPADTWDNGQSDDVPSPHAGHCAVWTGSLMLIWGGANDLSNTGARYDPTTDTWTPTSRTNAPEARHGAVGVWTGDLMLVWGGGIGPPLNTGGRYDPASDSWTAMSTIGAPEPRRSATGVWTGSLLIVWGGDVDDINPDANAGGRYDPRTDSWRATTTGGAPSIRSFHTAVWTGQVMVVWGGESRQGEMLRSGGRYNPVVDRWESISVDGAPSARFGHTAVWTGTRMVVWGGLADPSQPYIGGQFDPLTDTWTPVSATGQPARRYFHTAVWTGTQMIIWGADTTNSGGRYDPVTDTWTPMSTVGSPSPRSSHSAVWTGSLMVVWGGHYLGGFDPLNTGGRYDPATDSWTPTFVTTAPPMHADYTAVWTGSLMVVWGGANGQFASFNTGSRYDPVTDTWSPTSVIGAPSARHLHTAVWTGSVMVVWGGTDDYPPGFSTGGRYDPIADTWTPTSTTGAPDARAEHTAVWTGTEMIVWGGIPGPGGRYNPATDAWTPISAIGEPVAYSQHTAVWTGSTMVVWGGRYSTPGAWTLTNTGGRYDPVSDTWTPTSTVGAPVERLEFATVWTGSLMVVWGGKDLLNYPLDSGGRYDPIHDGWTPTSTDGAPSARYSHSGVWTDLTMVVWGGGFPRALDTGGQYNPETDLWTPTATVGAPGARTRHTAVWTGSAMIVWGGDNHLVNLNTIGRYFPHAGGPCDDGDACTSNDACDLAGLCRGEPRTNCDDGNVCTADACDAAGACFATHRTVDLDISDFSAHRVDGYDLVVLADAWNSCPGDPRYNAAANLDQGATQPGSCVDETDFHFFMSSFGQNCPSAVAR